MLRITVESRSKEEVVLKVEGWVGGRDVSLLAEEGARWLGQKARLVLDLGGVQFIDEAGLSLLKDWSGKGLVLRNGSMFVETLLRNQGLRRQ